MPAVVDARDEDALRLEDQRDSPFARRLRKVAQSAFDIRDVEFERLANDVETTRLLAQRKN